jgi:hypothetical protein
MGPLSSMRAWRPKEPMRAAEGLGARSPASVREDDQAERDPDSNPSAKIRSSPGPEVGEGVKVGVEVEVGVLVGVAV